MHVSIYGLNEYALDYGTVVKCILLDSSGRDIYKSNIFCSSTSQHYLERG